MADKHIIGVSVGIMQNGQVVFARGYGVADVASGTPVTPSTMFAIGSVTKQFTCSALLMLQEQKKLSLRDPVAKYCPSLTRAKDITLLDLGGHLSGYRDYYPLDYVDREMAMDQPADTIIPRYATRPLDFEPRSHYSYSNTGYLILGRVIEKVSGESFGSYLKTHLFTPLKLGNTQFEPAPNGSAMAHGYTSFALSDPIAAGAGEEGGGGAAGAGLGGPPGVPPPGLSPPHPNPLSPPARSGLPPPPRLIGGCPRGGTAR